MHEVWLVLAADWEDSLKAIVPIIFTVLYLVAQFISGQNEGKRRPGKARPRPAPPAKKAAVPAGPKPAGGLHEHDGALYRPAQDCSRRYGYAVVINRVDRLSPTEYEETEVSTIPPTWHPNLVATHTFNFQAGLTVVDGRLRRPRFGA